MRAGNDPNWYRWPLSSIGFRTGHSSSSHTRSHADWASILVISRQMRMDVPKQAPPVLFASHLGICRAGREGGSTYAFQASRLPKSDKLSELHPVESLGHHGTPRSPSADAITSAQ
jgi:hypothetical protein